VADPLCVRRSSMPPAWPGCLCEERAGHRAALRISPRVNIQGIDEPDDEDTRQTYLALAEGLAPLELAYLSYLPDVDSAFAQEVRRRFGGPFLVNSGSETITTRDEALTFLKNGDGDAAVVGRAGLANPDLVRRWRENRPLNEPRPELFYTGGAEGYIDYPALED
jgi:N-ethylmaleimide reductase